MVRGLLPSLPHRDDGRVGPQRIRPRLLTAVQNGGAGRPNLVGLIVIATGVQFVLTRIKAFMSG